MLVLRNGLTQPEAARQILTNVFATACYAGAGFAGVLSAETELSMLDDARAEAIFPAGLEPPTEPVVLRLLLLLLLTVCCYGVEVLFDRQRRLEEEARESAQRQQQLESTGRFAAEIAHQLKNPLGIINNAAFTLQRTVKEGKTITQQIQIIREEVQRSDQIITELMGYARLVEGKVERLDVVEELEAAIREVFPPAAQFEVQIQRQYAAALPPLLAQRTHVAEVFVNLLQNAREAMQGRGQIQVGTAVGENMSIVVTVADNGPGIAPESRERVFEAYFTTKDKGTGLGLAIVKNNVELYGGRVGVESELGKGARFILEFPARTAVRLRR
jgi:signal transduction histidine kinase